MSLSARSWRATYWAAKRAQLHVLQQGRLGLGKYLDRKADAFKHEFCMAVAREPDIDHTLWKDDITTGG